MEKNQVSDYIHYREIRAVLRAYDEVQSVEPNKVIMSKQGELKHKFKQLGIKLSLPIDWQ